jgi:L-ascorbate metabolism protein UlaG (beta-lactamase superfamily)
VRIGGIGDSLDMSDRGAELDRLHRALAPRRHWSLLAAWITRWFRPPAPARLEPLPPVRPGQVSITFAGHATALIRYARVQIVIDPMLGRWLGGVRRAVEPGLAPADLSGLDLILITHGHADHLHLPTLARLPRSATVVAPAGVAPLIAPLGFARVVELAAGSDVELRGVQIVATATRHGDLPRARGLAYVVLGDGPSVYACGDSGYFSGFADVGARFAPDLALLPIGGYWPRSFRARHLSPLDALYAFEDLRARVLVPIHHGAFALSYELLAEPARWLAELVAARGLASHVCMLSPGQSELFVPARPASLTGADDDAIDIDVVADDGSDPEARGPRPEARFQIPNTPFSLINTVASGSSSPSR